MAQFERPSLFGVLRGVFLAGLSAAVVIAATPAADWPQFLGPQRNGISTETGLLKSWPQQGPSRVWDKDVGEGYSGPVVVGERLLLFHRVGDQEVLDCLNAVNGKNLWKFAYATQFEDDFGKGNGPRATPTVNGKHVITLGADGWLHCITLDDGRKVWGRNVNADYKVPRSFFGVGSSPLVSGKLVLVNVGGKDAGIVAFALDSGKEIWKATSDGASYASPVLAAAGNVEHAAFFTRNGVVLLDPASGSQRFSMRWRARYEASVNAATPLAIGDLLFASTSYETGGLLLRVRKDGADVVWQNDESMSNHYNTCIYHEGHLYGFHGRQEAGPSFRCVELKSGKVKWDQPRFGCGAMVLAEGHLILLTERGELILVEATAEAFRERSRARVFETGPCRAQIALANGKLYARDQKKVACFSMSK
jgi:outer membrane protein assembly factor BamB